MGLGGTRGGGLIIFFSEIQPNLGCELLTCVSCSTLQCFWSLLLGAFGRGQTVKYQLQSQFQRLLNQTLCVFSQMKDIKHVRRDSHLGGLKAAYSVTMNIFRKKYFLFKSFVKVELSYVFTIKMFSTAENCMEK